MSYDFRLFERRPGEDPHVTASRDSGEFAATPPDPHKEALKRKVADALIDHNPKLEVFQFEYDEIAELEKISVEEARLKYRHLELNGPEEDFSGIQITLFDDEASVTVPYWYDRDKAADIFREIWSYLEIIHRETGYLIYDPQLEQVIVLPAGPNDSLACYTGVTQRVRALPIGGKERRPWWKFWDSAK